MNTHGDSAFLFRARVPLLICFALAFLPAGCARPKPTVADQVIPVARNDPEMQAAIAKPRSQLPVFWKAFAQPGQGESSFALKYKITDAKGVEHFWLIDIERKDGKVYGTINNDPNTVQSVKIGQRIDVADEQISDWMFMRNGKMVGNYTLRPLLKSMPPAEAAKLKAILEEP
jgi:uncharacterized protein YegJ (DUF2314 family)